MNIDWRKKFGFLLILFVLFAGFINLDNPSVSWDEGWTLMVARNWVEMGHYGQLLEGEHLPKPGIYAELVDYSRDK